MPPLPNLPHLGQGVPGGPQTLANLFADPPTGLATPPAGLPHIHPAVNEQPLLPLPNPQSGPGAALVSQAEAPNPTSLAGAQDIRQLTQKASLQAVAYKKELTDKGFDDPTAEQLTQWGISKGLDPNAATKLYQAGLAPSGAHDWLDKLGTETGQALVGLGPGLVKTGVGLAEDTDAALTHSLPGTPGNYKPFQHTAPIASAIEHSYGETVNHPIRQLQQNPLDFIMNAATPFSAGAGAVVRGADLTDIAGEVAAGNLSKTDALKAAGKTLIRPKAAERSISISDEPGALTLKPPAYKSALASRIQTKVLDPLLEKHLRQPSPINQASNQIANFFRIPRGQLGAAARFGRKARQDLDNEIRTTAGGLQARMPEEQANEIARGHAFTKRWLGLHAGGVDAEQAALQPWRDWTAIKAPPVDVPTKGPEYLTPADLKSHPYLQQTDGSLARQFLRPEEGGSGRMIPSTTEAQANPGNYRYVPSELIRSMKPYSSPTGSAATVLNAVDRGTQLIRSGRFLTPAYAQWAVQNGLIHLSQAGPLVFRNAWQLRQEWPKLTPEVKGMIDGAMGKGIARATSGGEAAEGGRIAQSMSHIQQFWHKFDDQWARRMSAIHELNAAGYYDAASWSRLARSNPDEFRKIVAGQGNREAINYTEMTPSERQTFQKLFTAYGWTRGASTYAARFPLQHPVQARVGGEIGQEGSQDVEKYYQKLGGMVPDWLRSYLPLGAGGKMLDTQFANPAGTLGGLIGETPGVTKGQTESLTGELAPVPTALLEMAGGRDKYGNAYKGDQGITHPLGELASRFKPLAALETFGSTKKGGTFKQSHELGAMQYAGVPVSQLRNPSQTASLGEKDYEESLTTPDKIHFQFQNALQQLPTQLALYRKETGQPLGADTVNQLKDDLTAVEQRNIYQYHYAQLHGAKSWQSLPPANKLAGTLEWLKDHGYTPQELSAYSTAASGIHDDKTMDKLVSQLWDGTGIGKISTRWKDEIKKMKPPMLTAPNP